MANGGQETRETKVNLSGFGQLDVGGLPQLATGGFAKKWKLTTGRVYLGKRSDPEYAGKDSDQSTH